MLRCNGATISPGSRGDAASRLAGELLDTYSQDELMERIALLEAEIERVRAQHAQGRQPPLARRLAVQAARAELMGPPPAPPLSHSRRPAPHIVDNEKAGAVSGAFRRPFAHSQPIGSYPPPLD